MTSSFQTLLFVITKSVYNVCFHPLRNYPGPLLARATRLYHMYYDLAGVQHLKQKEWHDKYGEVVRVAPDELSYNSAQAWFDICGMFSLVVQLFWNVRQSDVNPRQTI